MEPKISGPGPQIIGPALVSSHSVNKTQHAPIMDHPRAASVLSMDDLEAAQALEGLRSGMCFHVAARISPKYCQRQF